MEYKPTLSEIPEGDGVLEYALLQLPADYDSEPGAAAGDGVPKGPAARLAPGEHSGPAAPLRRHRRKTRGTDVEGHCPMLPML